MRRIEEIASDSGDEDITMGELIKLRLVQLENDPSLKSATLLYWQHIFTGLTKSWPELEASKARKIKPAESEKWAGRYARKISGTRFNNTLSGLKRLFEIAIDRGVRVTNPAGKIKRFKPSQKDLTGGFPPEGSLVNGWTISAMAVAGFHGIAPIWWNFSPIAGCASVRQNGCSGGIVISGVANLPSPATPKTAQKTVRSARCQ